MQNPSDLATRATRKTTRFSVRDAKYNAAGAMHRVAWALQTAQAIGQKCEKPKAAKTVESRKQSGPSDRTGPEQPTNSPGNSHFDTTRDAKYDARRFYCLRRLGTLSIATNLQLLCSPIYRVTNSRPIQIYRVMVFRLQGHLQGHIKNP